MDRDSIIHDITNYMIKFGGNYPDWYVGIASSPSDRLFTDHNVEEKGRTGWIHCEADTESIARSVESYFIDQKGTSGGKGGGTYPRYVYAYKITQDTVE